MQKSIVSILILNVYFLTNFVKSQSFRFLENKVAYYQDLQNNDSIIFYAGKIVELCNKKKYPMDFYYCTYKYLIAEAHWSKLDYVKSNLVLSELELNNSDTLLNDFQLYFKFNYLKLYTSYFLNKRDDFISSARVIGQFYDKQDTISTRDYIEIHKICQMVINFNYINESELFIQLMRKKQDLNFEEQILFDNISVHKSLKIGNYKEMLKITNHALNLPGLNFREEVIFSSFQVTALIGLSKFDDALSVNSKLIEKMQISENYNNNDTLGLQFVEQAIILVNLLRISEAEHYFQKAFALINQNVNYYWALGYYAGFMEIIGNDTKSYQLNKEIYDYRVNHELNNPQKVISTLNSLAGNCKNLGLYHKAKEYCLMALDVCNKNSIDSLNSIYYTTLSNLAVYEADLGNFESSLELNKQALSLKAQTIGSNTLDYAITLNNIAEAYNGKKEFENAAECLKESLKIRKEILGVQHRWYALSLANLGVTHGKNKNFKKAIEYNELSKTILSKNIEINKRNFVNVLENLSIYNYSIGDFNNSMSYALECNKLNLEVYQSNLVQLNENEALIAKYKLENSAQILFNLYEKGILGDYQFYSNYLNSTGLLYSNVKTILRNIKMSGDPQDLKDFLEVTRIKREILNQDNLDNNTIDAKVVEMNILSQKLFSKYSDYNIKVDIKDFKSKLKKNEVFLDFASISRFDFYDGFWIDTTDYFCIINTINDSDFFILKINEDDFNYQSLLELYQQQATNPDKITDLKSEKFYNSLWKPIADKIGDAKTIYVSLGGVYNNINLNTIYNPTTGKYLIEEKDIRIVNSARDFVLRKESEKKNYTSNTASLFGFPNFDGNTTVSADTSDLFASTRDLNSFWLDSLTRGGMKAKPLPATKIEVENISSRLKSKGWQVNSFLADNASETNIKKQQSPRILHVATHGYFFQDIPMDKDNNRFLGMDRQQVVQDPMLRSGLLLTGSNRTLKGESSTGENGLLSAAEASLLDLRETELVVLSACETGKGEVKNSEGVYGLRKAFSDAGAQNIIMSLWKVDDKVTQEFMSRFYEIWLNDKTSIREAFNRTQLEIKAKYPQPYYWGAFILVGE
jgi:CHAT domain-containing protein